MLVITRGYIMYKYIPMDPWPLSEKVQKSLQIIGLWIHRDGFLNKIMDVMGHKQHT